MTNELKECFENIKEFLSDQIGEVACDDTFDYIRDSIKDILVEHGKVDENDIVINLNYNYKNNSLATKIKTPEYEVIYTLESFINQMEFEYK